MKSLIFIGLFLFFSPHILGQSQDCPYSMVEKDGRYYLIQRLDGELPSHNETIEGDDIQLGINDVKIVPKKGKEEKKDEKPQETRIRIRYESDSEEDVKEYLESFCRFT